MQFSQKQNTETLTKMFRNPQQPFDVFSVSRIPGILGLRPIVVQPSRQSFHRQHPHPVSGQQISQLRLAELLRLSVRRRPDHGLLRHSGRSARLNGNGKYVSCRYSGGADSGRLGDRHGSAVVHGAVRVGGDVRVSGTLDYIN